MFTASGKQRSKLNNARTRRVTAFLSSPCLWHKHDSLSDCLGLVATWWTKLHAVRQFPQPYGGFHTCRKTPASQRQQRLSASPVWPNPACSARLQSSKGCEDQEEMEQWSNAIFWRSICLDFWWQSDVECRLVASVWRCATFDCLGWGNFTPRSSEGGYIDNSMVHRIQAVIIDLVYRVQGI